MGPEGTAAGDLDRVFNSLGQIGEQRRHLLSGLEVMLCAEPAPGLLLVNIGPFGDADQRVVGFIKLGFRKIDVVRRHERKALCICHFDETTLGKPLRFGQPSVHRMSLKLDIEAVRICRSQAIQQVLGLRPLSLPKELAHRSVRPSRQADETGTEPLQLLERDLGKLAVSVEVGAGIQLHQILVSILRLREQNDGSRIGRPLSRLGFHEGDVDLATDDRLYSGLAGIFGELKRGEHVVRIRDRDGRHIRCCCKRGQRLYGNRAFQKRVFGMESKMDESGAAHVQTIGRTRTSAEVENPVQPMCLQDSKMAKPESGSLLADGQLAPSPNLVHWLGILTADSCSPRLDLWQLP